MRKSEGITLIALIITIVVMLILAAVTITIAVNGGIFKQANEAGIATDVANTGELLQSELTGLQMEKINDVNGITKAEIETRANGLDIGSYTATDNGDGTFTITGTTKKGNTIKDITIKKFGIGITVANGNNAGSSQNENLPPNAPMIRVSLGTLGDNNWYISDVTVEITAEDDAGGNGIQKVEYACSGATIVDETIITSGDTFNITADGVTTVTAYTYDNAGLKSASGTLIVKKDTVAPTVPTAVISAGTLTAAVIPTGTINGLTYPQFKVEPHNWYTSDVTIQVTTGTDSTSGVQKVTYTCTGAGPVAETAITSGGTFNVTADGTTTVTCYTYDQAGNKSAAATLSVAYIDKTAPGMSLYVETTITGGAGNMKADVSDAGSGIIGWAVTTSTTAPTTWNLLDAAYSEIINFAHTTFTANGTYYLWVKDAVGNTRTAVFSITKL